MPPPHDLIILITLVLNEHSAQNNTLNPPVYRKIKVSSAINLELLNDKVIAPCFGWTRNYHTYYFRTANDTYYTQKDTDAADARSWLSPSLLPQDPYAGPKRGLKPENATLGDLLKKVGDYCFYNYDLGDGWIHRLSVEKVLSEEESDGGVVLMEGAMRCPPEDGGGCTRYQEDILDLYCEQKKNPNNVENARELAEACFEHRGGVNVNGSFRPGEFNLLERKLALAEALGSRNSTRNSVKTFAFPICNGLETAYIGQISVVTKKQDDRFGGFASFHETVNVKPDPRDATLCNQCGNPNDLKACARCHSAFYCSRECQALHWKAGHKKKCKKEMVAYEKYQDELKRNKADPNRFGISGEVILQRRYTPGKLRFKVGDKVECMIGPEQWGTGRIVRCLYREDGWPKSKESAPYQIKLDRKTADRVGIPPKYEPLIYSDWDDDIKVRKLPDAEMEYVD
eukprot:CAMPEP_0201732992 /NCGR_PEP_ID=MMETSP0593-20130828/30349_1 /ASSEMBLY_ACC=CAM_ASM_000672 /TAXON_ID=267983 /ORGANISM="Skeletonema japonicum, Strain CCMP2506" /LENGTH=455 /DNA_ID=CAMNT_0048226065 /DNA_START=8 /DNA_END=1375 /DNA_ORIENTATION=+